MDFSKVGWTLLLLAYTFESRVNSADPRCNYNYKIDPQYVYGLSGYHRRGVKTTNCQWQISSDTRVRFTCKNPMTDCDIKFIVSEGKKVQPAGYCSGSFTHESFGSSLTIRLIGPPNIPRGSINCEFQAVPCECGWKKPANNDLSIFNLIEEEDWPEGLDRTFIRPPNNTRIVGGIPTLINEYPMMAGLLDITRKMLFCGSTIISTRYVLTAAHCLAKRNHKEIGVLVGDYDLSTDMDTNANDLFAVEYYSIHPDYNPSVESHMDIAIIKTDGAIEITRDVGPVCLPFRHSNYSFDNEYVTLLGWGTTSYGGSISRTLQKVTVQVIESNVCRRWYPGLESNQLCTYANGKDSCQFDSGGPVLWQDPSSGRVELVGIISYGLGCAGNTPSLNTRITEFLNWIQQWTPEVMYCTA